MSPEVVALAEMNSPRERPNALDLGRGAGRNVVAFAERGYRVTATDISPVAIAHTRRWLTRRGLDARLVQASFVDDSFEPESFDIVTAVNVLYHGTAEAFHAAVANITAWLRPGGSFYFTCCSDGDAPSLRGSKVAENTYELSEGHLHYCPDRETVLAAVTGLQVVSLHRCEHHHVFDGSWQVSSRWRVLARKSG
jgi:SAM-dependent methyltransferase